MPRKPISICEIAWIKKMWALEPEFLGSNLWNVNSDGKNYKVQVYFAGYCDSTFVGGELVPQRSHGFHLTYECECEAGYYGKTCVHGAAVLSEYEKNWKYLFPLFNLPEANNFTELRKRAREVEQRLQENSFQRAA